MITIIHGDDTAASRRFFSDTRKRASAPVTLEAEKLTLTDLIQALQGGGLFVEEKDIFIEQLLTKRKKSAELTAILKTLDENQTANIYLWEGKELEKRVLAQLKTAKPQLFKLPQSLFLFLDSLKPHNQVTLKLFHQTLTTVEPELIFFMLTRHLRLLLALAEKTDDPIEEVKRMADWQRGKLVKQASLFDVKQLKKLYHKLYEIDLAQKTGTLSTDLSTAIDFWILEI